MALRMFEWKRPDSSTELMKVPDPRIRAEIQICKKMQNITVGASRNRIMIYLPGSRVLTCGHKEGSDQVMKAWNWLLQPVHRHIVTISL